ncbi:hypothetical protein [Halegenticoccus tardaugens]|uniref:hypothetical protein n=1 Tax=Halegenticoccus tardaugens TaxID=2071624 RepID=UPI00100AE687|nr:hypothetical protein [Halegenticoccus tardaugens]
MLPKTTQGKITVGFLVIFTIAMNPPVITMVDSPTTVLGINVLYLWTVAWGLLVSLVLIWAAWQDAFALTEDQVPPELREAEGVETARPETSEEAPTGGGS